MKNPRPDQSYVASLLDYCPETGVFKWKVHRNSFAGKVEPGVVAGNSGGRYRRICIDGRIYRASHLAWLLTYGRWPEEHIDHINRQRFDDRICNLREATQAQNMQNKSVNKTSLTGIKGVFFDKRRGLFGARICINYKSKHLGYFSSAQGAGDAYVSASLKLHPFSTEQRSGAAAGSV